MPLMSDIRNNLSKLFAGLAVFFILFIVFDWGMDITGRRGRGGPTGDVVGKINGREITYREFSELVRRAAENQKKQTGQDVDEDTERQIRSQVWNQLVDQALIEQEMDRLGITVTDQEIVDIVQGPNPPDFLVNQFKDSTGLFHRDAYIRAMADPQNRQAWLQVEDALRQEQRQKKLQDLLMASVRVTDEEVKRRFVDRNETFNAAYALFDIARLVPDSAAPITDSDIKQYYNSYPEEFRVKAARRLKYVLFAQTPSSDDTASVLNEMNHLLEQAKSGVVDFVELAKTYSDIPVSEAYFKHGELSRAKESAVFSAKKGDIVGPIKDFDGYHLIKILDERQGTTEFVKASHILINFIPGPDSGKALQKAREVLKEARSGKDFAELARLNSQDFGSASQGGELGWTGKGGWVKPFEEAAFKARVGEIVGPVRTQFGWHIIKVTGKDKREVKIATLSMKIKASTQTVDLANKNAEDFAYLAKDEGFEKSAELSGYQVRETQDFQKGGVIPGIGLNDAAMSFAFKEKLGALSQPIAVTGGMAVFKITNVREDGVRPFDEAKPTAQAGALRLKKLEIVKPQVDAFYKGLTPASDILTAAAGTPNIAAAETGPFHLSDFIPGLGRDLKFAGVVSALNVGEISKPFDGNRGYFIVKLMSASGIDTASFAAQKTNLQQQILNEKRNALFTEWRNTLREKASIEDHRDKFFR